MKTHLYSGWLVADCDELCLSLCPPAGNNNEAPALADLISCDFQAGDPVFLRYCVYPELLQRMFIGQLSLRGLGVGCYDILIVFEMTHQFSLVPVLMIAALVSQAVSRKLNRENFYDAVLTQDGHQIEHVRPPRGLQGWQLLPVSAIANFRPVVLGDLNASEIQKALKTHPYQRFPVTKEGTLAGILTRKEAEAALAAKRAPRLEPATTCQPGHTIRQLQALLIESSTALVALTGADGLAVLGVVTLHDLLRSGVEKARSSEE